MLSDLLAKMLCKKAVGLFGESREKYIFVNALPFGQKSKEKLKAYKVSKYFSFPL
jgi:hypothetical protein